MDTDSDVFDYDKSRFFRILQSAEYKIKFDFIQQQQGIVVCPLKMSPKPPTQDLINRHLFIPSPFYKNHYVPLNSLIALASLKSSTNVVPMDHYQQVYLILNSSKVSNPNEIHLMSAGQRICPNVKLLNVQMAFTDNNKSYKILIVDRTLTFKSPYSFYYNQKKQPMQIYGENDQDLDIDDDMSQNNNDSDAFNDSYDDKMNEYYENSRRNNRRTSLVRNSLLKSTSNEIFSIEDVKTFGQCIDFMHESQFIDILDESDDLDSNSESSFFKSKKPFKATLIGQELLDEIELFRKTYIIIHTHLDHCAKQLYHIYSKYVKKFINSYKKSSSLSDIDTNSDLMISIACENVIVGCLFSKLWSNVLLMNHEQDEVLLNKCKKLFRNLKLNGDPNESIVRCGEFFKIDKLFFMINDRLILKEFKR